VSCRILCHSEISWSVRRWQILNKREFSNLKSSILNSVLLFTAVHYFHMNRQEPKQKGLSESRFGSMVFLLQVAGIPCKMKKIPTIYVIYMITVITCAAATYLGVLVDVYVYRDDLGRAMTTLRALIAFTNVVWIFLNCR